MTWLKIIDVQYNNLCIKKPTPNHVSIVCYLNSSKGVVANVLDIKNTPFSKNLTRTLQLYREFRVTQNKWNFEYKII